MLPDFARVAGGENFRETKADRFRHRIFRKGKYILERYGHVGCVGCGRCVTACVPRIASPVETFNAIAALDLQHREETRPDKDGSGSYIPQQAALREIATLGEREKLFRFDLRDEAALGHQPGQFVMISVPGIGEAPISVSSSPSREGPFELAIRDVGNVTHALHGLEAGATVGVRGPFGNGFPVESLEWKDLVLVAGGIGLFPLRSLVQYVLDHRERYGEIFVLYGARSPEERMFSEELASWSARDDLRLVETVDQGADGWQGNVGLITTLIPPIAIDPARTVAVVVGPPVMYRFAVAELKKKGLTDSHIILSLERHMKCGTGKCGHCQINELYVCQDGPVFSLEQLRGLPEGLQ
jgi:sulfite reductase subunit B